MLRPHVFKNFALVWREKSPGVDSLHVAVEESCVWDVKDPIVYLTAEAETADELCDYIDAMIEQLGQLKLKARHKFVLGKGKN